MAPTINQTTILKTESTYQNIIDAIVTQKLKPSQKVSEKILSDMFGIGRTEARNLIERLLAQQFLVTLSPRVTQVAPLTLLEIKQNFTLRKILLTELVAMSEGNTDIKKLQALNKKIEKLLPIKDDQSALQLLKANKKLNLAFTYSTKYPLMYDWAQQLENTAMRIYWLHVKTTRNFPYSSKQQDALIDTIRNGDTKKIRQLSLEIIVQAEERILDAIFSNEQFYTQDLLV
jgi:DNA-binding GntR family transcriptional regulator